VAKRLSRQPLGALIKSITIYIFRKVNNMIKKMLNIIKPNPKSPVDKDKIQQMVSTLYKENEYL
jgi:hypothetical protein